jgi:isoquinoline 1-oxidoreductase beta subunit
MLYHEKTGKSGKYGEFAFKSIRHFPFPKNVKLTKNQGFLNSKKFKEKCGGLKNCTGKPLLEWIINTKEC